MFLREFQAALRIRVRFFGLRHRLGRDAVNAVLDGVEREDDFDRVCRLYEAVTGTALPTAAAVGEGDRPVLDFFKWLLEWLASEEGQGFIRFLFSLFGFAV